MLYVLQNAYYLYPIAILCYLPTSIYKALITACCMFSSRMHITITLLLYYATFLHLYIKHFLLHAVCFSPECLLLYYLINCYIMLPIHLYKVLITLLHAVCFSPEYL